jgi:catechol-2,3-dioxygenase
MSNVSGKSIDAAVRIGHVHLKVADLERAIGFYHGVLGFDVVFKMAVRRPSSQRVATIII